MHPNLDRTLGELWGTRGSILLWSSTKNQSLLMAIDFNLVQQLWKFNWFPCLDFGYVIQKFIRTSVIFLRSLMPKNSSGMQKSYLLNIYGPNIPSHFTVCFKAHYLVFPTRGYSPLDSASKYQKSNLGFSKELSARPFGWNLIGWYAYSGILRDGIKRLQKMMPLSLNIIFLLQ